MNSGAVDTKVVELQFENKDFEKNATQSISTLEKLKESLNFSADTRGLEDINKSIKAVNFDNLNNGIKEASNGFSMMETIAFGVFNRLGARIADFAVDSIGKIFTFVPNQIWTGGKSRSLNMEQAKFQIEGLGEAWEEVAGDINYAVDGTAYGLDVAAKAASQLMASGVQFGEIFGTTGNSPMAKALRGISGVAAMTGSSYEEITDIFTTVAGQGRVMAGELNRIAARGLNASQKIAEFMNEIDDPLKNASENVKEAVKEITGGLEVTEADIRDFVSKGLISFDIFTEAMDSAFGDHAQDANKTFAGTITNIKAQLSKLGEVFVSPAIQASIPFLNNIYDIIKALRKAIAGTEEEPTVLMKGYLALVNGITGGLELITGAIKGLVTGEGFNFVDAIKKMFGIDQAEEVAEEVTGSFETIRDTAFKVIKGDFGNGMERINKLTEEGFDAESIQDYVNALWEVSGHDWSQIFDEDVQQQAAAMLDLSENTEKCAENGQDLADQQRDEQKALRQMTEEMSKSDRVMFGLINIFTGLSAAWESIKKTFTEKIKIPKVDFIDVITTKFFELSAAFKEFTTNHADDIAAIFSGIYSAAMLVWGAFRLVLKVALVIASIVVVAFGGLLLLISNIATSIYDWAVKNQILEKTLGAIEKAVNTVRTTLDGWWKSFKAIPGVQKAIDSFKKTFSNVFSKGPKDVDRTNKAVVRFCKSTKTSFKLLREKKTSPKEFFEQLRVAWKQLINTIGDLEFVKNIKASFGLAKDALNNWLTQLGTNADGTINKFGQFYEKLKSVFGIIKEKGVAAWSSIKDFFSVKLVNKVTEFGTKLGNLKTSFLNFPGMTEKLDGFKKGIVSAFSNIPSFVSGAVTHFSGFFSQMKTGFSKLISGEWSPKQFWDSTKLAFENVVRYFTSFKGFDEFKQSISGLATSVGQWLDNMGTNADGTRNKFGLFLDKLKEIKDWIVEKFEFAKTKIIEFFGGMNLNPETLLNYFKIIKQGVSTFISSLPDFFSGAIGAFGEFFERLGNLKENGALTFENILFVFKDTVGKYFKEHDVFAPIKAAFGLVWSSLKTKFKEAFPGLAKIIQNAFEIFNNIKSVLKDPTKMFDLLGKALKNLWKILKNNFKKKFKDIGEGASGIGKFILDHLKDLFTLDSSEIVRVLIGILVIKSLVEKLTALKAATAAAGSFGANMLKLAAAIAIIAIVVVALSKIENPERAVAAALGIVVLIGILTGIMVVAATFASGAELLEISTAMLELSLAIGVIALVMAALTKFEWTSFLESAGKLAILIGLMAVAMAAMSLIGPVSLVGTSSALMFAASLGIIVWAFKEAASMTEEDLEKAGENIALGIKAFCEKIEGVKISQEALDAVGKVSEALTGASWTAFWGTIGEFVTNVLPGTGKDQTLMERFQDSANTLADTMISWSEKMASIKTNKEALRAVNDLADLINEINVGQFWTAVGQFVANLMTEGEDKTLMQRFQESAVTLSDTIGQWNETMKGVTIATEVLDRLEELASGVDRASKTGLDVAMDTFSTHFTFGAYGESTSVEQFGEATKSLADALTTWNENMTGENGEEINHVVEPPLQGIEQLGDALREIPGYGLVGAIKQYITGTYASVDDINNFKARLSALAQVIDAWNTGFVDEDGNELDVSKVNEIDLEGIKNLAAAVEEIPGDSLFTRISNFLSGTDKPEEAEKFKGSLEALGGALSGYAAAFEDVTINDINKGKSILVAFNELIEAITQASYTDPGGNFGGITNVAGQLENFLAPSIKNFADKMTEITNISDIISIFNDLATLELATGDIGDESKVSMFSSHLSSLTDAILEAASKAFFARAGIDKLKEEVDDVNNINLGETDASSTGKDAADSAAKGIEESKSTFSDAMSTAIGGAIAAIRDTAADFTAAGFGLIMQLSLGMRKAKSNVDLAAEYVVSSGSSAPRKKYSDFYSSGGYLGKGFANGMRDQYSNVWSKATELAGAAIDAIKARIKQGSPSKVTYESGKFTALGFINGIMRYVRGAYSAGDAIADSARKGVNKAIDKINQIVSSKLDTSPVVRPVLDLSEIQNGASSISSMINTGPSLALAGNMGAINAALTNRTDPNVEIVDALSSLKNELNRPNNTYNIDGITYDDGSNIVSAVETLVRAARVERRV